MSRTDDQGRSGPCEACHDREILEVRAPLPLYHELAIVALYVRTLPYPAGGCLLMPVWFKGSHIDETPADLRADSESIASMTLLSSGSTYFSWSFFTL